MTRNVVVDLYNSVQKLFMFKLIKEEKLDRSIMHDLSLWHLCWAMWWLLNYSDTSYWQTMQQGTRSELCPDLRCVLIVVFLFGIQCVIFIDFHNVFPGYLWCVFIIVRRSSKSVFLYDRLLCLDKYSAWRMFLGPGDDWSCCILGD